MDTVDVMNAARLVKEYCKVTTCSDCCIKNGEGTCPLAIVPFAWDLEAENDSRD